MTITLDTCEKDIIVSTEIDDIIFTSSPLDITYDEQEKNKA